MNRMALEAELRRLSIDGTVTPEQVVEAARPDDAPLHGEFNWDDASAAHQHRLDQARTLIKSVRLVIRTSTIPFTSVAYVKDVRLEPSQQGYVPLRDLVSDEERASLTMDAELLRLNALIERVREIASVIGQRDRLDQYLMQAAGVPSAVAVAA